MCLICEEVNNKCNSGSLSMEDTTAFIRRIAVALKKGNKFEHFEKIIDRLIGVSPASNRDLDASWQEAYWGTAGVVAI